MSNLYKWCSSRAPATSSSQAGGTLIINLNPISKHHFVKSLSKEKPLSQDARQGLEELRYYHKYRQQKAYVVQLFKYDEKRAIPIETFIVKTKQTLHKIKMEATKRNLVLLYLPNPVKIPKDFWETYKKAKTRQEKNKVIKDASILSDANIFAIERLVIDIDSAFDEVYTIWRWLAREINLKGKVDIYKTKSNRFRAVIHFKPRSVQYKDAILDFYLYPSTVSKNKRTHKENFIEMLRIFKLVFEFYELRFDPSFMRLNHPIILEDQDIGLGYQLIEQAEERVRFYDLYRELKNLQKRYNVYYHTKKRKHPIKTPSFMLRGKQHSSIQEHYKTSVKTLSDKHQSHRFINVMLPACGWAKSIGLSEDFVRSVLCELLSDKENFNKDFQKAWKYAKEIDFGNITKDNLLGKTYEDVSNEVLTLLLKRRYTRQELIKRVFQNQKWLCDRVLNFLQKAGFVEIKSKTQGRGRPKTLIFITHKGRRFVNSLNTTNIKLPSKEKILGKQKTPNKQVAILTTYPIAIKIEGTILNPLILFIDPPPI